MIPSGNVEISSLPLQGQDWGTIYNALANVLRNSGVSNNLWNVTDGNVTNFSNLSFWTDYWMITFQNNVDLTNADTHAFLENLENAIDITGDYIFFNPQWNGAALNAPTQIQFWPENVPFIWSEPAKDYVIARDTDGNILSDEERSGLLADNLLSCDMWLEGRYCNLRANHFTSFQLFIPPVPGILPYREGNPPDGFIKLVDDINNPQYMVYMRENPIDDNGYSYEEMQNYTPNKNEALPTTALMNILLSSNHSTTWVAESGIMQDPWNRPDWVGDATWEAWYNLLSVNNNVDVGEQPAVSQWPYFVAMNWSTSARIRTIYTSTDIASSIAFSCDNVTDVPTGECNALVDLYNATNGDNWSFDSDDGNPRMSDNNVCNRYGIYCEEGHVIWMELEEIGLDGDVPSSISGLQYLQEFDLYGNSIKSIPDSIWELTGLISLELSDNVIHSLPDSIGKLVNLNELYIYDNYISSLPDISHLSALTTLDVSDNRLSAIDLHGLTSLQYLFLADNLLTTLWDDIMDIDGIGWWQISLENNCRDTSSMSTGLVSWINQYLEGATRQEISNPVCADDPKEVAALTDLYNATGGPDEWDSNDNWWDRSVSICTRYGVDCRGGNTVRWLILKDNYLSGSIPSSFGNLTHLNRVNLQDNNITSIPDSIGNLSGINVLILDHNNITSIPASISGLINLGQLNIQNNQINSLPDSIGDLHNLRRFFFNDNWLTNLPDTLTQENIPNMDSSYFSMENNCIWTWRVATGVMSFLNDDLETDRWDQFHCAMPYIIASEYSGNFDNSPFDSWFLDNVFIYDYLPTWVNFTSWDENSLLVIYNSGFSVDNDTFAWNFLWIPTYNARLAVGYGNWDGVLRAPSETTLTAALGEHGLPVAEDGTWTRRLIAVREVGASWATLIYTGNDVFSGADSFLGEPLFIRGIQLSWYVSDDFNQNSQLTIYRSETGASREQNTPYPFCLESFGGVCLFVSDRFSYFSIVQETPTRSEIYWPIRSGLVAQGIHNNLDEVNNENITGFSHLYFEIEWVGRIEFLEPVDLSTNTIQQFLTHMYQNISSYLNMTWWLIAFNPDGERGSGEWLNVPAQVTMYFATYPFGQDISANNREAIAPYIIVKDSDGETISGDMLSNLSCHDQGMQIQSKGSLLLQSISTLTPSRAYCEFTTEHFTSFALIYPDGGDSTTSPNQWGGGGWMTKDNCPNGDTSASFYDGKCDTIVTTTGGATSNPWYLVWSPFTTEINNAYLYAFTHGITTMPTILQANMTGNLIRSNMAKMIVNYAIHVSGKTPNTWAICSFDDIWNQSVELQTYIKLSCQLWLMWVWLTSFSPDGIVTRAEFGTVLSRLLYGSVNEWGTPYYIDHLSALKAAGIMNTIADPEHMMEIRWYVMLMLMRAAQ